jgi:hypothetical protein
VENQKNDVNPARLAPGDVMAGRVLAILIPGQPQHGLPEVSAARRPDHCEDATGMRVPDAAQHGVVRR